VSKFGKGFLSGGGKPSLAAVAGFGKLPVWSDHPDTLSGDSTDVLRAVKHELYDNALEKCVGIWEHWGKEGPERLIQFGHSFVWLRDGDSVAGRIWAPSDSMKRSQYPYVICAQCMSTPLSTLVDVALPRLIEVQRQCDSANDPNGVQRVLVEAKRDLGNVLDQSNKLPLAVEPSAEQRGRFRT